MTRWEDRRGVGRRTAVMLAIVTIASHRTHTAAIMHKSTANDDWSYYQANSIKLHNVELGEGLLSVLDAKGDAADKLRAKYADQKKKYSDQKDAQQERRRNPTKPPRPTSIARYATISARVAGDRIGPELALLYFA